MKSGRRRLGVFVDYEGGDRDFEVAQVGDSVMYTLCGGGERCSILLVQDGRLSRDEIATHPQRSVITRAIGVDNEVDVDNDGLKEVYNTVAENAPNDVAPSGYNDPRVPEGLPESPLSPAPSPTGFRWSA